MAAALPWPMAHLFDGAQLKPRRHGVPWKPPLVLVRELEKVPEGVRLHSRRVAAEAGEVGAEPCAEGRLRELLLSSPGWQTRQLPCPGEFPRQRLVEILEVPEGLHHVVGGPLAARGAYDDLEVNHQRHRCHFHILQLDQGQRLRDAWRLHRLRWCSPRKGWGGGRLLLGVGSTLQVPVQTRCWVVPSACGQLWWSCNKTLLKKCVAPQFGSIGHAPIWDRTAL
mmetsp:Transcript_1519/g.5174  ORF Transcript_1519/g.5174 Transcript_1519/m.5174 type:complete len:224 (+) Transcript_1519:756-1427(+)